MTLMKKTYTSAFKAKLVLELLKGEKSLTQLASEHKVHQNLLRTWRDLAIADFASLFDKKQQAPSCNRLTTSNSKNFMPRSAG
jgi:transposase-like protein